MTPRVLVYVQHLLGIGHLKRASLIVRRMAASGLDVSVALGGRNVPGIDFTGCARIFLPPAHAADDTFATLIDEDGRPIDDAWRERRATRLLSEFAAFDPNVVMIELFPFGRRMFAFELLPLLAAARARPQPPVIVCSLRDILVHRPDATKNRKAVSLARSWFDRILVHGDARLVPIEASFPEMADIAERLTYTGYVVEPPPEPAERGASPIGAGEVIVSVGGGAVGLPLLRAALAAKPLTRLAERTWRLITGPNLADAAYDQLAWSPPPGVIVERWRPDLPAMLQSCAVSISQAGYNTVMDVLQAGARAVFVPFAAGNETEQTLRAQILDARGWAVSVDPAGLTAEILAAAVDKALTLKPPCVEIDRGGITNTARIIGALARRARAGQGGS
ncbi:MAG: glycosyl transferase family 28 [Rhodospirillales bacterium]|nr:glycosyl transferase family 28 [Rhodospirillales bacterium]